MACSLLQAEELVSRVLKTINEIVGLDAMYNHRMMHFLQAKMGQLMGSSFTLPDSTAELTWKEDAAMLLHCLKCAFQMVKKHTYIDIGHLYKTADAQRTVNQTLEHINKFAHKWGFGSSVDIPSAACAQDVQQDKKNMEDCLGYVFEDSHGLQDLPESNRQAWEVVKHIITQRRHQLAVIAELDITWDAPIFMDLRAAKWGQTKVAVKQVIPASANCMELVDFAKFYTWTFSQMRLNPQWVVRLHGVTRSGAVVMQWSDCSLMNWYDSLQDHQTKFVVAKKIQVLDQAAKALLSVHRKGIIYGDMKSNDFLIFSDTGIDCTVKIAPPKLAHGPWDPACSPSSTGRWMAPEIYEGQAPSIKSDIFSFGVIMCELVMEKLPYGQGVSEVQMMQAKLDGREPLVIPDGIKQQWPVKVLGLMQQCYSRDPQARPSMDEVCSCLESSLKIQVMMESW